MMDVLAFRVPCCICLYWLFARPFNSLPFKNQKSKPYARGFMKD